jgi:hypothetical protein
LASLASDSSKPKPVGGARLVLPVDLLHYQVRRRSVHLHCRNAILAGASHYLRRYAGRVATGKSGFSDPAMA